MLVGVWLGLDWVLFYFFDHYIQSSVQGLPEGTWQSALNTQPCWQNAIGVGACQVWVFRVLAQAYMAATAGGNARTAAKSWQIVTFQQRLGLTVC